MAQYVDIMTDAGFKAVFQDKQVTIKFLNAALAGERQIKDITYLDKEIKPEIVENRTIIFDLLCEDVSGAKFILEMQNCPQYYFFNRGFYYLCRMVARQGQIGSPDKSGGKFFNSIENLHLCTMNNQGLLALAQLILPSEILSNFEVVRVEEEASLIRIYLDESVKAEYKENPEIESKGFCEAVTIRDFPIRDKGVDLIVRRRKWYDKQNNRYFSDSYDLKAEETRYSKEFAAFLKGVYGDDSYDLPFA